MVNVEWSTEFEWSTGSGQLSVSGYDMSYYGGGEL